MLEFQNINFSYSDNKAIFNNFNLSIKSGFTGLVGKNGAGKSTLLKLCLGFVFPNDGNILINNQNINKNRTSILKNIGVAFEKPVFPTWTKTLDFLIYVGQLRGLGDVESIKQSKYLLHLFDLSDQKDAYVSSFSAGMMQKYSIIQAVIGLPKLIFLDEPTANLDVETRTQVLEFLRVLVDENDISVIIMSHILSDLERYCDSVAILHEGQIKYYNTIENLIGETNTSIFQIRGGKIQDIMDKLIQSNAEIIRSSSIEVICEYEDSLDDLKNQLPDNITISPYRSKLEQKFIEVTGEKNDNDRSSEL